MEVERSKASENYLLVMCYLNKESFINQKTGAIIPHAIVVFLLLDSQYCDVFLCILLPMSQISCFHCYMYETQRRS